MPDPAAPGPFEVIVLGAGDTFSERHRSSALLLRCGGVSLAIDCPDMYRSVLREASEQSGQALSLADIDQVLITHVHGDHMNGLEGAAFFKHFAEGKRLRLVTSPEVRASIGDIAKAARLTPGLVHYHFKSKQEILLEALRELVARHEANLDARLEGAGGDPAAGVAAFIDLHLGLGADADPEALACWILLGGEALREPKVRVEFARALERSANLLADVIRRGVARGVFSCDSPDAAAAALVATIHGYFVLAATARSVIPKGSAAASAKRMAQGLLGVRP